MLVDTGHHYQAQNIEQIVAWLLSEDMLGGFHFNDRRYADDDLTLGSIDPYQVFRIFNEIIGYERETGKRADIAYMIDQSHNLKDKIEEMIQTAVTAQELYSKAVLVDHEKLGHYQMKCCIDRRRRVPEAGLCHRCAPGHSGMAERARDWRRIRCKPSARPVTRSERHESEGRRIKGRRQATLKDLRPTRAAD